MCGIAGILNFDGTPVQSEILKRMTDSISHRGPDDSGLYISDCLGLGHRRLSIIDLSSAGKQPMPNEDKKIWITFNGEIYNFKDIRAELKKRGHRFISDTDTEIVIHAYEEWGVDCLKKFNGMFAFALWDEKKRKLWLVRDRLGVKPLFYYKLSNLIIFGSEIKAVLCDPRVERQIDYEALSYYLALNYTPGPHTLFKGIRQLLPGHFLMIDCEGNSEDVEYWDLVYHERYRKNEKKCIEEFSYLLEDSIRLRLVSDVPFGAFLSGGLDSSSVAYYMSRNLANPLKTFTIGFGEPTFDEVVYAQQVARLIGSEHNETIVTANAAAILPKLVWHSEEPTADSSMIAVYYLAQETRKHVAMVLSGDGGDEILAGYETYQAYYFHRLYRMLPEWLKTNVIMKLIELLPSSDAKVSLDYKLRRFVKSGGCSSEDAHATWRMIFDADDRRKIVSSCENDSIDKYDVINLYRQNFLKTNAQLPLNRLLYVDTRFYLPNDMLVKVDRMTMANSLEAREPLLDYRLVEFAASLPPRLKLKYLMQKKYILKASMKGKLPNNIVYRKKAGFNVPNARWIKKDLKDFVMDHLSEKRIKETSILDADSVGKILADHFQEKADNSHKIWCLLTLVIWLDIFKIN